ncbi:hypothetical protein H4582DRAFT_2099432 [Lactarius indigo]|nr:hypothetical protein H4582DRAFT_2099432 [Lactarius indigo]
MITESVTNVLNSSRGFCAGLRIIVDHQRINGMSFVCSAAVPAFLAASASEANNILQNTPSSRPPLTRRASPITHIYLRSSAPAASVSAKLLNLPIPVPREALSFDIVGKERLLHDIVDEALAQGMWTRLSAHAALSRKECKRADGVIKAAVSKALTKHNECTSFCSRALI